MAPLNQYENDVLGQAFLNPDRRIPASCIPRIEDLIIELGILYEEDCKEEDLPIKPEYWEGETQYHRMIHAYEKRAPHFVLTGVNIFDREIVVRDGNGDKKKVTPGEKFRTHVLVDLFN